MRTTAITALFLSLLTSSEAIQFAELLRFTSASATRVDAVSALTPNSYAPAITQAPDSPSMQKLDLRRAVPVPAAPNVGVGAVVPPAVPTSTAVISTNPSAITPSISPAATLEVPPAIMPAPPAAVPPAPVAAPPNEPGVSITVQWVETWIGGTSRTWLPHTITLRNEALSEAAPPPGKGKIGMGTLTGRLGVTRTVIEGAAKTVGPEWKVGAMAVMGIGIAGMV
ncbi:hypothetical protein P171DRAFT_111651 [Karstenula rhodostoma CBS 690.94]|uniref:Uncharacterized protein n=1 Tax=Karstenula rhodostoma CBS 690.94 TaxID=1392251 RepID=A0A9P4P9L8_9PLEO|nr:hypothetical protein P171DRAFT_111651 [Karstenula rhodostoma CBS 690.94]